MRRVELARAAMLFFLNNSAPVAQLDRASGYEPEGREFESPRAHHFFPLISLQLSRNLLLNFLPLFRSHRYQYAWNHETCSHLLRNLGPEIHIRC